MAALLLWAAGAAPAATLHVEGGGGLLIQADAPEGAEWCLTWNHSVTGGAVADCFENRDGRMVLTRAYLHDFAAGLGTVEGRGGTLVSAEGGGYWIEGLDEPIPGNALPLRVGRPSTDHRLRIGGMVHALSSFAAGQRVVLRLLPNERDAR
jgi:hypothetical protein